MCLWSQRLKRCFFYVLFYPCMVSFILLFTRTFFVSSTIVSKIIEGGNCFKLYALIFSAACVNLSRPFVLSYILFYFNFILFHILWLLTIFLLFCINFRCDRLVHPRMLSYYRYSYFSYAVLLSFYSPYKAF